MSGSAIFPLGTHHEIALADNQTVCDTWGNVVAQGAAKIDTATLAPGHYTIADAGTPGKMFAVLPDSGMTKVNLAQQSVGDLHFGDSLETARQFGRPDVFEWSGDECEYCILTYARAGLRIDFDADRLNYVVFFLDCDEFLPDTNPPVVFSRPCIDSMTLSKETTLKQVVAHFGIPKECDDDDDEIILYYSVGQLTVEFEAYQSGFLKRINIYPTKPQK